MDIDEKMQIASALEELNVDIIEAGFPIASQGDFKAVQEISKSIKKSSICALARALDKDIEIAAESLKDAIYPSHPMELGYVHGELATLDRDLPEVPFADAEYQWVMYSSGIEGDVERAFDAVTKTWGFTTRYGTKVKCAWVLVIVSCGWK